MAKAARKSLAFISGYPDARERGCQQNMSDGAGYVTRAPQPNNRFSGIKNCSRWFFQYIFSTPQHGGRASYAALFLDFTAKDAKLAKKTYH
jgi:hypothetical protein